MVSDDDSDPTPEETEPKSEIARMLARLKQSSFDAVKKREKVPQPLFWSLFNTEINEIKRKKARKRLFASCLESVGDEE